MENTHTVHAYRKLYKYHKAHPEDKAFAVEYRSELLITIMSSLAQEESRSISENCTWGQRKRFADGKVTVPFKRFLGYDRGKDGNLVVNLEQAKIAKRIYAMYLQGKTCHLIAKALSEDGIPSPAGKPRWNPSNIKSILTNEKYKGDALLQKSFTTNFLTKEHKVNEGEIPQYYVTGNHEAIIEPDVWELVQREMERRKSEKGRHSGVRLFSGKVYCGECGTRLGSKVWHSTDKYKQVIWQCNKHCKKNSPCRNGMHLSDEELKAAVLSATNKLIENKDEILNSFQEIVGGVYDTHTLEGEKAKLESEMDVCAKMIEDLIRQNATTPQDQSEYQTKYEDLERFYNEKKGGLSEGRRKVQKDACDQSRYQVLPEAATKTRQASANIRRTELLCSCRSHHGIQQRRYPHNLQKWLRNQGSIKCPNGAFYFNRG